jgi:hypothetical protein
MANTQPHDTQNARIQGLLARYLELRSGEQKGVDVPGHLDEDTLNAFTEGRLDQRQATPAVSHLTNCSFCRHRTVELVRLEMYFAEQDEPVLAREQASQPASVSSVLSGILSKLFGSSEAAVFAHEDKKENEDGKEPDPSDKSCD